MARIRPHRNKDGKLVSQTVVWRAGGRRGAPEERQKFGPTRADLVEAKNFAALVEANGNRRPKAVAVVERGVVVPPAAAAVLTVADLLNAYIEATGRRARSDRTAADYRSCADTWLVPTFGHEPADDLEDVTVQEWVDDLPRAPKTVANIHGLLAAAYKWGQRRRLVRANPCAATELPRRIKGPPKGLRSGEWALLHQAALDVDPDVADLLLFLVGTGWRWSEASALRVHAVDLDRPDPLVEVAGVHRRNAAGRIVDVNDAKSAAGHMRYVRLSPELVKLMRRRVRGKPMSAHVFTNGRSGQRWLYNNFRDRQWTAVLERAAVLGLESTPTLHWLRHTQAGILLEAGAPMVGVQRRLGHASITTTVDTYGRLVDDVSPEILAALDRALFRRPELHVVPVAVD